MAFKLLTDEQKALLTENMRAQYEKELQKYNERVAFVDYLERHEHVVIEPFEPQLINVSVIGETPGNTYSKPEYVIENLDSVIKPEIPVRTVTIEEAAKIVLPERTKKPQVRIEFVDTNEEIRPKLPRMNQAVAPEKQYRKVDSETLELPVMAKVGVPLKEYGEIDIAEPLLPDINTPQIGSLLVLGDRTKYTREKPTNVVKVVKPRIEVKLFTTPEVVRADLPKSAIELTEIIAYSKPEQTVFELPQVSKLDTEFYIEEIDSIKVQQPVFHKELIEFVDIKPYFKPGKKEFELPEIAKPSIEIGMKEINKVQAQLPECSNIVPITMTFSKTTVANAELPSFTALSVNIPATKETTPVIEGLPGIIKPVARIMNVTLQKPIVNALPNVQSPHAFAKTIMSIEKKEPQGFAVVIPAIPVKSVQKIAGKAVGMPDKTEVYIPDAFESLKNLLQANYVLEPGKEQIHEK